MGDGISRLLEAEGPQQHNSVEVDRVVGQINAWADSLRGGTWKSSDI